MVKHAVRLIAPFISLLILSISFIDYASAQGDFVVIIENPVAGQIINEDSVNLNLSVTKATDYVWVETISYTVYLDGSLRNQYQQNITSRRNDLVDVNLNLILTNLTQSKHTIRVDLDLYYCPSTWIPVFYHLYPSTSVDFFVYRGIQPQVAISALDAHGTDQTTFNITTNERGSDVSYSLDGAANVTLPQNESTVILDLVTYNVTLSGLPFGFHTLTAYAKDVFNQTAVAERTFTEPLSPSMIAIIVTAILVTVVACAATLLRYKKVTNPFKPKT